MKTMKTVESRVLQILRDCPETRNEDMKDTITLQQKVKAGSRDIDVGGKNRL